MRKIFLDCGTNLGQGFEEFIKLGKITNEVEVHCFEPNPYCEMNVEKLKVIASKHGVRPLIQFHDAAVFNKDSDALIVVENKDKTGQGVCITGIGNISTSLFGLRGGHSVKIKTMRLSKFIEDLNLSVDDEIRIKLDIEGSEFVVLQDMLENKKSLENLREIWVEWHERLFPLDNMKEKRIKLTNSYVNLGIVISNWY